MNQETSNGEAGRGLGAAPCSAVFDSETVEAALKRTEATACAMKEPDCSDVLAAEVRKLRTALKDANDLCRSAYQVAVREGRETNWPAYRDCLSESLDRQHRVMYPPNGQAKPQPPTTKKESMLQKLTLISALAAVGFGALLGCSSPKITWQCDDMRARITKYEQQKRAAAEFNKTNINPMMVGYVEMLNFDWRPRKGDIELGYRADGVVVWRPLPEAP